jgi:hypothetical protein
VIVLFGRWWIPPPLRLAALNLASASKVFLCVDDLTASVHHPHPTREVGVANRNIAAGLQTIRGAAVVAPVAPPVLEIADVSSRVN